MTGTFIMDAIYRNSGVFECRTIDANLVDNPQIIMEVMSEMPDLKPEEVVYCGDSDVDMITGHNAGVRTLGVCWGFRGRAELESCNPWLVVETPSEITEAVLSR